MKWLWLLFFVLSVRDELRLQGEFDIADKIKTQIEAMGITVRDTDLKTLREWKKGYGTYRGKAGRPLYEIEML